MCRTLLHRGFSFLKSIPLPCVSYGHCTSNKYQFEPRYLKRTEAWSVRWDDSLLPCTLSGWLSMCPTNSRFNTAISSKSFYFEGITSTAAKVCYISWVKLCVPAVALLSLFRRCQYNKCNEARGLPCWASNRRIWNASVDHFFTLHNTSMTMMASIRDNRIPKFCCTACTTFLLIKPPKCKL